MSKIFVSIAAYRDPELVPTLRELFNNADHPENLRIGICWQRDNEESLEEFTAHPQIKVVEIPFKLSKGACWARYAIHQLYDKEEYYLQLDSHHRLVEGWDTKCIDMLHDLQDDGHEKPLLTGYIPSYDPQKDPEMRVQDPWRMVFDRFIPEGAVFFLPETIPGWQSMNRPVPARFFSAHFVFTLGQWVEECEYDPDYYFHGEEISLAARSFTWGYDLFHPHIIIAWHEYTRKGRTKCWDDDTDWVPRNDYCHWKNRSLFSMDGQTYDPAFFGRHGFGEIRTLRQYEKYAGLEFGTRKVHVDNTGYNRKNPDLNDMNMSDEEYESGLTVMFRHFLDIWHEELPERDYEFIVIALHNDQGETLWRKDLQPHEFNGILNNKENFKVFLVEAPGITMPDYWVVWPHSKSKGWGKRIEGRMPK
jgi:hypothetical protein